jgi:hypothetical protein
MYALMTDDPHTDRMSDSPDDGSAGKPDLVLVEGSLADEPRRPQARRRKPPLPTLHLEADEILHFPAA